jgi:predicted permease
MTEWRQEIAWAVRRLARTPGLAALVVATLALGIGVTTAVFAIFEAAALRPLPFPDPGRLMALRAVKPDGSLTEISYPNFLDVQARSRAFSHLGFFTLDQFTLGGSEEPDKVLGSWVTAGYFRALGVEPLLGRLFTPAEGDAPGAPVALLSYDLWQRRFAGDPHVLGRALEVNQVPMTIVGVLPPSYRGLRRKEEIFIPVPLFDRLVPGLRNLGFLKDRDLAWGLVAGCLAPGVDPAVARAEAQRLAPKDQIQMTPAGQALLQSLGPRLLRLLGAASLVFLIACANVGHLLLTRAAGRHREAAVRAALGATRGRLIRQPLVEGLLLGLAGGAAGLLTAAWSLDLLLAAMPLDIPAAVEVRFGGRVLLWAAGLSLLGGALSALAPALHSAWPDLAGSLKQGGRGSSESPASRRTRRLLVAADVALALMLLLGAGLMVRSLEQIRKFDPGFRSQGVLSLTFEPPSQASDAERIRIKRQVLQQVAALRGVRSAAVTSQIFFDNRWKLVQGVSMDGLPRREPVQAQMYFVSSGFFRTLGIPLEAGRDFLPADHRSPVRCAIVNRAFAERHLPPGNPLGRKIRIDSIPGDPLAVIGVVGNVRTAVEPGTPAEPPQIYLPGLENPTWVFNLVISSEEDPRALASQVRQAIRQISPDTAVFNAISLGTRVTAATSDTRSFARLMGVFAAIALALAALAIHSLVLSMIQQETRDIGVRRALGAGPGAILRHVLARALPPVLLGIAVGLAGAVVLARTLSAVLFDVAPLDPATFLVIPPLFAAAALAASFMAAEKALEIPPMEALRAD